MLSPNVETDLALLFLEELNLMLILNQKRRLILNHPEYSVMRIYLSIEPRSENKMDGDSLIVWFRQNGYLLSNDEVFGIIRRIDLN